jgi:hypothetical protein
VPGERTPSFGQFDERNMCSEVRAASAHRMHSAALLRSWASPRPFVYKWGLTERTDRGRHLQVNVI